MKVCKDQQCRLAGRLQRPSAFPRNRQSDDGRYLYCKECCRRRTNDLRATKGERQQRRIDLGLERKPVVKSGMAFSLVYEAIKSGKRTREEIQRSTKLSFDDIGDALVEILFVAKGAVIKDGEYVPIEEVLAA